jgi:type II secretory pathway pseudopilin PulG
MKNIFKQGGFGLIVIMIAILIIAIIFFGTRNRKGQVEQGQEVKIKAVNDLEVINDKLKNNNQEIEGILSN